MGQNDIFGHSICMLLFLVIAGFEIYKNILGKEAGLVSLYSPPLIRPCSELISKIIFKKLVKITQKYTFLEAYEIIA